MPRETKTDETACHAIGKPIGFLTAFAILAVMTYTILLDSHSGQPIKAVLPLIAFAIVINLAASFLKTMGLDILCQPFTESVHGFTDGAMSFGKRLSDAVNFILLSVLYFIGVGATSLAMKAAGKRFMDMRFRQSGTYYAHADRGGGEPDDYLRQFYR